MRLDAVPLVVILLLPAGGAWGDSFTVSGRARVKVWSPSHALVGRPAALLAESAEAITIALEDQPGPLSLPRGTVTRLQISRGEKHNAGRGAVYGMVAGALLGLIAYGPSDAVHCCSAPVFAGATGAVGSGLGALVGVFRKTERWNDVPVDRLRVGAQAGPGRRIGIHIAVRF